MPSPHDIHRNLSYLLGEFHNKQWDQAFFKNKGNTTQMWSQPTCNTGNKSREKVNCYQNVEIKKSLCFGKTKWEMKFLFSKFTGFFLSLLFPIESSIHFTLASSLLSLKCLFVSIHSALKWSLTIYILYQILHIIGASFPVRPRFWESVPWQSPGCTAWSQTIQSSLALSCSLFIILVPGTCWQITKMTLGTLAETSVAWAQQTVLKKGMSHLLGCKLSWSSQLEFCKISKPYLQGLEVSLGLSLLDLHPIPTDTPLMGLWFGIFTLKLTNTQTHSRSLTSSSPWDNDFLACEIILSGLQRQPYLRLEIHYIYSSWLES